MDSKRVLYIFLDEGGNLDFSTNGTEYFVLTALSKHRSFEDYEIKVCDTLPSGVKKQEMI